MTKTMCVAVIFVCGIAATLTSQSRRDMSGVWAMDPARSDSHALYGQLRIVRQTESGLDVAIMNYDARGRITMVPWKFRINEWGPRRGPVTSTQPRTNARWVDDRKLVLVKAPGTIGAALWVWTISDDGNELIVEDINPAVSWMSDLRRVAPPELCARHVFVKKRPADVRSESVFAFSQNGVNWSTEAAAEMGFRLDADATTIEVTCRATRCRRVDLYSGRRVGSRVLGSGDVTSIRTTAEVLLEFSAR